MILTVDIGNSNIVLGAFSDENLIFISRIKTDSQKTEDEYAAVIKNIAGLYRIKRDEFKGAVISCVVPQLTSVIKKAIMLCFEVDPIIVNSEIKTDILIDCDDPSTVGADLITVTVAAHELYNDKTIVLDMGTATKFVYVDKNAFRGVAIAPGVRMGLDGLAGRTAQLPQIGLESPTKVIGKNTADCMKSGIIYGTASMIDGMISRIKKEYSEDVRIIATGGFARVIVPYCETKIEVDESFLLKGLRFIYEKNKGC